MTDIAPNIMTDGCPPLHASDVSSYNIVSRMQLHHSVVDFLSVHNGGSPSKAIFSYTDLTGECNAGEVLEFLPFCRRDRDDIAHVTAKMQEEGRICSHFIVAARESGGNLILVDNTTGLVFLWDHEKEGQSPDNCHLLSVSLHEFFSHILYAMDA